MKKYAVIVAGGSGTRMGNSVPKQFLHLHGKPVLWHTLNAFLKAYTDLEIILVIAKDQFQTADDIIRSTDNPERIILTTGGQTRFHSVKNGLAHVQGDSIVFVHDGVRCLVTADLIHHCYEMALKHGNAIPAIEATDSIRIETTHGNEAVSRERVKIIQTPQAFLSDIIKMGYEQEFEDSFTDDATVVERLGVKIHLVTGEATNIKITRPGDFLVAAKILEEQPPDI